MAPRHTDTRERILDLAVELLQERGFNAFSYHHIAEDLGIKNAAIHYHFPSKADLGVALVQRYLEQFESWAAWQENAERDPTEKLDAYFRVAEKYMLYGAKVCPLGILEAEFHAIPQAMQSEAQRLDRVTREWMTRILEQGRELGQFCFEGSVADKALVVMASIQGVLQMARAAGNEVFFATARQLKKDLAC